MELFYIVLIVLAVAGGVFWYFNKDQNDLDINDDGKVDVADLKEATKNVSKGIKAEVKKLPTPAKLKALTKTALEELGRDFGVELDKRKNKDSMIADLKKGAKAQQK
jgi:hypothetical protein|tara:strand:- start:26044 stop:26364 length:321 start_codon:yes stop_codon:yes gene_type:complete